LVHLANVGRTEVPERADLNGPPRPPRRLEVFGVGPDWVQLTWSALGPGEVTVVCGEHGHTLVADGGPGAHMVSDLPPATSVEVRVRGAGIDGDVVLPARTLALPPGAELLRVATVSDVHVGSRSTGYFKTMVEIPRPAEPHALRCLRAAVGEATAWGAQHLVVKGDLVDRSHTEHWSSVQTVLGDLGVPVHVLPGNHERSKPGDVDPRLALRSMGLDLVGGVQHVDRGGIRIVMADTTRWNTDWGTTRHVADGIVEAASVAQPVLLTLHHQPMRLRLPTYLPPGLPSHEVRTLFGRLAGVNDRLLVTSGHTHRHRRHRIAGVTATEVGSTKDFPGTWAGYHIHEGGVVQVVRRISEPSCIRWTDHTRRAAAGVWGLWAPGLLRSRCFSLAW
jgi:3',5'-cyclic-AMP phosphodiesterase